MTSSSTFEPKPDQDGGSRLPLRIELPSLEHRFARRMASKQPGPRWALRVLIAAFILSGVLGATGNDALARAVSGLIPIALAAWIGLRWYSARSEVPGYRIPKTPFIEFTKKGATFTADVAAFGFLDRYLTAKGAETISIAWSEFRAITLLPQPGNSSRASIRFEKDPTLPRRGVTFWDIEYSRELRAMGDEFKQTLANMSGLPVHIRQSGDSFDVGMSTSMFDRHEG